MENFKVKNRLVYGGYIALLWLLGGLAFYYILNMQDLNIILGSG